uniref:LOB domain-containing protein n=1 Tax=Ananas comosus var. bracteatus TaxID=296719 RepID=A0A6V7QA65_ANACO|nr:unnamed protein product [Ananas comosus var. bracteatus]
MNVHIKGETRRGRQEDQERVDRRCSSRSHGATLAPLGTAGGMPSTALNTVTPCAACKFMRRRCTQQCPFFPYFSPHEPQKFASVHKVFGASNASKILSVVPESQRADAANTLVYEANMRLQDPVYGCTGVILALQQQVQALEAELGAVKAEVLKYKYRPTAVATAAILPPSTSHAAAFLATAAGVSVAAPRPLATATPAPASSSSSMYTTASSSTDYSSVTNENAPYFG